MGGMGRRIGTQKTQITELDSVVKMGRWVGG